MEQREEEGLWTAAAPGSPTPGRSRPGAGLGRGRGAGRRHCRAAGDGEECLAVAACARRLLRRPGGEVARSAQALRPPSQTESSRMRRLDPRSSAPPPAAHSVGGGGARWWARKEPAGVLGEGNNVVHTGDRSGGQRRPRMGGVAGWVAWMPRAVPLPQQAAAAPADELPSVREPRLPHPWSPPSWQVSAGRRVPCIGVPRPPRPWPARNPDRQAPCPVPRAPVRCAGESSVEQAEQRNGRQWKEFDIPHLVRLRGVQVYACELRVIAAVADELTVDGREMKPKVRKERRTF
jgi:hypothetical protein